MKKGQCKDALEIYKRFLTRMTRVSEFLKVAEVCNIQLCWEYNFKTLAHVSGVNEKIHNLAGRSATKSQSIWVGSDLRRHPTYLFTQSCTLHSSIPSR